MLILLLRLLRLPQVLWMRGLLLLLHLGLLLLNLLLLLLL